jgi:YVTN family beta-propeller protein
MELSNDNQFLYVTNHQSSSISKIQLSNNVRTDIAVQTNPIHIAAHPTNGFIYVANHASNTVSKVNVSTNTTVANIAVQTNPSYIKINNA